MLKISFESEQRRQVYGSIGILPILHWSPRPQRAFGYDRMLLFKSKPMVGQEMGCEGDTNQCNYLIVSR